MEVRYHLHATEVSGVRLAAALAGSGGGAGAASSRSGAHQRGGSTAMTRLALDRRWMRRGSWDSRAHVGQLLVLQPATLRDGAHPFGCGPAAQVGDPADAIRARNPGLVESHRIQMSGRATEVPDRAIAGVVQRNEAARLDGERDVATDAIELEHAATSRERSSLGPKPTTRG